MRTSFKTLSDLQAAASLFEDVLDDLSMNYKTFLLTVNVNGEAVSDLNDLVKVAGMRLPSDTGFYGILYYNTPIEIPKVIKTDIEIIFDELFYDG